MWPKHAADFAGFPKWPTKKEDLPDLWAMEGDPKWSQQILDAAAIGDDIEHNLDKFPDEGTLGFWLQCPPAAASLARSICRTSALHFDLHNQWSRGSASEHGLNNGQVNITNYMFWKLHGWIDKVLGGLPHRQGPEQGWHARAGEVQARPHSVVQRNGHRDRDPQADAGSGPVLDCPPDVDETGDFHTKVRPIFEDREKPLRELPRPLTDFPVCGHDVGRPGLEQVHRRAAQAPSNDGGQFQLVAPGDPDHSYLYLKPAGLADAAGCVSTDPNKPCNTAQMPPGGMKTMTDDELAIIHKWIADGANYP